MRLLDLVAQANEPLAVELGGKVFHLPGPAEAAPRVRDANLRFVLNPDVLAACREILQLYPMVLDPRDPLLRLPSESFWLEWPLSTAAGDSCEGTAGLLAECDPGGRCGTITGFWASAGAGAEQCQARIAFDFDRALPGEPPERLTRFFVKDRFPLLQGHAVMELPKAWRDYFVRPENAPVDHRMIARRCAQAMWNDFPLLLAFIRLLGAPGAIERRPVERAKLNKARASNNKPPLLDHVELVLRIGEASGGSAADGHKRGISRRHLVRGHVVHRQGRIFWRSAHFRGSLGTDLTRRRTTRAVMARGYRFRPDPIELAE